MIGQTRHSQNTTRYAKDLLDVATMPRTQILALIRLASTLKKKQQRGVPHRLLGGKTLGLLFQ